MFAELSARQGHLVRVARDVDLVINVWGADHHGYVARMKAAIQALGHDPDDLEVVITQLVRLERDGEEVRISKRAGDLITLDVSARSLHLHVSDEELAKRRAAWVAPPPMADRGYTKLYIDHVLQADQGVDFDFLRGSSGAPVARDNH